MKFVLLLLLAASVNVHAYNCVRFRKQNPVTIKATVLSGVNTTINMHLKSILGMTSANESFQLQILTHKNQTLFTQSYSTEQADQNNISIQLKLTSTGTSKLTALVSHLHTSCPHKYTQVSFETRVIPAWLSLLPALITLVAALLSHHVIFSLVLGIFTGAICLYDYNPLTAFLRLMDTIVVEVMVDPDHIVVMLFTFMVAGMVALLGKSGGAAGLARKVILSAKCRPGHWASSYSAQVSTFFLGLLIFFDDYSSVLIVGSTTRPITDRLRISREKLAFLVDSMAAPLASLAPISSWIGFELVLIKQEFQAIEQLKEKSAYITFLKTIPHRYYPFLLFMFLLCIILMKKDFGPMYTAEMRARITGKVSSNEPTNEDKHAIDSAEDLIMTPKRGVVLKWWNAMIPIGCIIVGTLVGFVLDGYYAVDNDDYSFENMLTKANSFNVLMWSGGIGFFVPMAMYWGQGIMLPKEAVLIWIQGMKGLMEPTLILIFAWCLGSVVKQLNLSGWLIQGLEHNVSAIFLPSLVFLISGFIAFSTGSSWSTMSILFPVVIPLAWNISNDYDIVVENIASILAGSVFGDHCSPISDTTILSSISSKCEVKDHVKTQAPYAFVVAIVSILICSLPVAASSVYNWYIALPLGMLIIAAIVFFIGKPVEIYVFEDEEVDRYSLSYRSMSPITLMT